MKNILKGLVVVIFGFFIFNVDVSALTFSKGDYIGSTYVKKVKNGMSHYLSLRFIEDEFGRAIYCLEPFTLFYEGKEYVENEEYTKVTSEILRRVELLAYYGYGYEGRTDSSWYAITQVLIWREVDPLADVYFTSYLNGKRNDSVYANEISQIIADVDAHDKIPSFVYDYEVNYDEALVIRDFDFDKYEILDSNYVSNDDTYLKIDSVKESGSVNFKQKKTNYYLNDIGIYVADGSQDLLLPGNIDNKSFSFNINVTKGNIELNINDNTDVYSSDSLFENVCYEVLKGELVVDSVCANSEMKYLSRDLAFGTYNIRQVSTGVGYILDSKLYSVTISKDNKRPIVSLDNYIVKNSINFVKRYCNEDCSLEEGAEFSVYDSKDNLVTTLVTDSEGRVNFDLGYGKYYVTQNKGIDGYYFIDDFIIEVKDDNQVIEKTLDDNIIPIISEPVIDNIVLPSEGEIVPPDTGYNKTNYFNYLILSIWFLKKIIFR